MPRATGSRGGRMVATDPEEAQAMMHPQPVARVAAAAGILVALAGMFTSAVGQLVVAPGFQASVVATGISGSRHQLAVDAGGTISIGEEVEAGGFGNGQIHQIAPSGVVTAGVVLWGGELGQFVRSPADGRVHYVAHWSGALDHNHVVRIEAGGSTTLLADLLWGRSHSLALDGAATLFLGNSASPFGPGGIYVLPPPAGSVPPVLHDPGFGTNRLLAWISGGAFAVAEGLTVTRVEPGAAPQVLHTYVPVLPGGQVEFRSFLRNPFGPGFLLSVVETAAGAAAATGIVEYVGPGGTFILASDTQLPLPGDFGMNEDGAGGLLLATGASVVRITQGATPWPLGSLSAPASFPQGGVLVATVSGRPFALSPFILAADLPLGPPAFPLGVHPIPPYGTAATSLGLLPSFVALEDGLGLFTPGPTPAGFLLPSGQRNLSYPIPLGAAGITIVAEAYIVDSQAPNGTFWISGPAFVTFTL